jgi:DNA mismatch repair protein MutS2
MQPLFRLDIGKPGSSFAFEIARKIGLPENILLSASEKIGEEHINFDRHLKDILRDKRYWERKRQDIRSRGKKLDDLISQYEGEMSNLKSDRKEILIEARIEAEELLSKANRQIENTIRKIKEAQAERKKTKSARAELETIREDIKTENLSENRIEQKVRKLQEQEKRVKRERTGKEKKDSSKIKEEMLKEGPVEAGDFVIIEGSSTAGEVMSVEGKRLSVAFGNIITSIETNKVIRIGTEEYHRSSRKQVKNVTLDWDTSKRRTLFKPEIDIRGKRGEEALQIVRDMVDEAIVIQHPNLRILHGKGDGILRHLIREYLSSADFVKSFRDEHVQSGGSGITLVELDV